MSDSLQSILKATCLLIYLLAIVSGFDVLPAGIAQAVRIVAVLLLAGHVLELLLAFDAVKRYRGPLVDSVALTLLFGFLHWRPLRRRNPGQ